MNIKEEAFLDTAYDGEMVIALRCNNSKLVRDIARRLLQEQCGNMKKGWFDLSFDTIKEAIMCAEAFADMFLDQPMFGDEDKLSDKLKAFHLQMKALSEGKQVPSKTQRDNIVDQ